MMFWRRRNPVETTIPYFLVRNEVERMYGRRRLLWHSLIWSIVSAILSSVYILLTDPQAPIWLLVVLVLLGGGIGFILLFVIDLVAHALDWSKEATWVSQCITWMETHGYHTDDQIPTRAAIRAMAAHGSTAMHINTPLPLALLAIIAASVVSNDLDPLWRFVLAEIAVAILLALPIMGYTAYADVIIIKALDEVERRILLQQPAPAVTSPLPAEALLSMLLTERAPHHLPPAPAAAPNGVDTPSTSAGTA